MPFHVGLPIYDSVNKCHVLKIDDAPVFKGGKAPSYEIVFEEGDGFIEFVTDFLKQASPYFSKPLDKDVFIQRIRHSYSTEEEIIHEKLRRVLWIPARVLFYPSRYEFQWIIGGIEHEEVAISPGTDLVEADISEKSLSQTEQKRIRQKVRQARLKCALARLQLERLTERYYAKYGNFDGLNGSDSELSSEIEFRENEGPRKI
jgi:hypothetical protein